MPAHQIAVVEDDTNIRYLIEAYLQREGYETIGFDTAEEAIVQWKTNPPELWILDIMLPGMDGYEFCCSIRKESEVPIIMISARDEDVNKIMGIELGSDDYLTKPFSPQELVARVKRQLYRWDLWRMHQKEVHVSELHTSPSRKNEPNEGQTGKIQGQIKIGGLLLHIENRNVFWQGEEISLTEKEFILLQHLVLHPNRAYSREELLTEVWGFDYYGSDRAVDHVVKRLRKKMEGLAIETVWGFGYRLRYE